MSKAWMSVAAASIGVFGSAASLSAQLPAQQSFGTGAETSACEVHVWQSKIYLSGSPAPYGALLQALHDAKYPTNSVEGQMEYEFRSEALGDLIGSAPWSTYLGQPVKVIVEADAIDKARLKAIKGGNARNSNSSTPCYFELYIGKQTFEGGFIKSHLFSDLTMRSFAANGSSTGSAIVWTETKHFPAKDEASVPLARQTIRDAFVNNVSKFLNKKLAKRGS
jgi:hypothetical protein